LVALQLSVVHGLPSSQFRLPAATQLVPAHASFGVQTLLSALQEVPAFCAASAQVPVSGSQVFFLQIVSPLALQVTTVAGSTSHLWLLTLQTSVPSQTLPFSKLAQSAVALHWQVLVPPPQAPLLQVSPVVHALPSLHAAVLLACWQPSVGLHASSVHALLSSQYTATLMSVPAQVPPPHTSPLVQRFASLHCKVLLV
jgi:hypothetical protein